MSEADSSDSPPLRGSPPLSGERVLFVGELLSMTHAEARRMVRKYGGEPQRNLTQKTTLVVSGGGVERTENQSEFPANLEQARRWLADGQPLKIIEEARWLNLLGIAPPPDRFDGLYDTNRLAKLLELPPRTIRRWERLGLLRADQQIYRLHYYSFQQLSWAKQLVRLLRAGHSAGEIERSLTAFAERFPDALDFSDRFDVLSDHHALCYRDAHGKVELGTGQRHFGFEESDQSDQIDEQPALPFRADADEPPESTDPDWQARGIELLNAGRPEDAIEAFRCALMNSPGDPETSFAMAEALYLVGRPEAALERYAIAIEGDHVFLEAWVQTGCLLLELDRLDEAREALTAALRLHPDDSETHWHLAELALRTDDRSAAEQHLRIYLEHDQRGLWADAAREQLARLAAE